MRAYFEVSRQEVDEVRRRLVMPLVIVAAVVAVLGVVTGTNAADIIVATVYAVVLAAPLVLLWALVRRGRKRRVRHRRGQRVGGYALEPVDPAGLALRDARAAREVADDAMLEALDAQEEALDAWAELDRRRTQRR